MSTADETAPGPATRISVHTTGASAAGGHRGRRQRRHRTGAAAERSHSRRTLQRARAYLAQAMARRSLRVEAIVVLAFYAVYEVSRAVVMGDERTAVRHAHEIITLERSLHLFVEHDVQDAASRIPGLLPALGAVYLTLHLAVTGGYLLWLHQRRPNQFPTVRATLIVASGIALIGYLVLPTAPPRLADIGIDDTVSNDHVDLNSGLISTLYNPYAALPSMHFGYALVIGASLVHCGRRALLRLAGVAYPALILLVIVATGNHFFLDAVAGAGTVVIAATLVALAAASRESGRVVAIDERQLDRDMGSMLRWTVERKAATERLDAVDQPDEARSCPRLGPTDAIVIDCRAQPCSPTP